jgi:hypothetical protein
VPREQNNVKRKVSMTTRRELIAAVSSRYRQASRNEKKAILDEFVAVTGYHRKHAMRLLRRELEEPRTPRPRRCVYDEAVRQALTILWEAADRVCGKRLKALLPTLIEAMQRHGHLDLDPKVHGALLQVSAATIDRALEDARLHIDGQRKRRKGVGSAIRRSVPVRTFSDWRDPPPGFFEIDMVEHCGGPKTDGDYVHSLVLTDIATGWTECVAMPVRDQTLVVQGLAKAAGVLPFPMLGVDSDNDSAFMNETVFDYCRVRGLEQTRSRAYKKNDQAWVEQKNGAIVRRLVGYGRLSGMTATSALARLYEVSRLYINFFQPSFKLKSRTRDGARAQALPRASHALREAACARGRQHDREGGAEGAATAARSRAAATRDPRSAAGPQRHRRAWPERRGNGAGNHRREGVPRRIGHRMARGRGAPHAPQTAHCRAHMENAGRSVRRRLAGRRGLADRRTHRHCQRADGSTGRDGAGRLCEQGAPANAAAARQGVARREGKGLDPGQPASRHGEGSD